MVENSRNAAEHHFDSRLKEWLRPVDASINYVNATRLRHRNTGLWFLESKRYRWFRDTLGAHLWIRGIPGSGKTVLASTIIEDLGNDNDGISGSAIIYFFFSFSDQSKQKLDDMLRSMIFQLVTQYKSRKS